MKRYLVLNGPHKGQWHRAHGGGTVLQLIDPIPPRQVRDLDGPHTFVDNDYRFTDYDLQALPVEDGGKRVYYHFWQTRETTRSSITIVDQLLGLLEKEAESVNAAEKERASIVTWLRHPFHRESGGAYVEEAFDRLADFIECGLHHNTYRRDDE